MSAPPSVRLSQYDNTWYDPGRGRFVRALWFVANLLFIQAPHPFSGLRVAVLRLFGAKVGTGVVIKPGVSVKYPWHIEIGDHTWIGERAWLDCLTTIRIGSDCCISQGAYLCTGNHDWADEKFGLIIKPITLEHGAWVGAKAIVLPGVTIGTHAIITAGSVASRDAPAWQVCRGNPAEPMLRRELRPAATSP